MTTEKTGLSFLSHSWKGQNWTDRLLGGCLVLFPKNPHGQNGQAPLQVGVGEVKVVECRKVMQRQEASFLDQMLFQFFL